MEDETIVGETAALRLWAAWYLQQRCSITTAGNRAEIEAWAAWHLSELVGHLEGVARAKGRDVDIPDPLSFTALLRILGNLEVEPAEFFSGVIQRWAGDSPGAVANLARLERALESQTGRND